MSIKNISKAKTKVLDLYKLGLLNKKEHQEVRKILRGAQIRLAIKNQL